MKNAINHEEHEEEQPEFRSLPFFVIFVPFVVNC